jgi:threonine dehydrogenase-like Zn-dependent dehydrogenase
MFTITLLIQVIYCLQKEYMQVGGKATITLARLLGDDSNLYSPTYLPKLRDTIQASIELISSGKISVPVTRIYKPEQIAEAVQHTIDGGKALLEFNR